jgi:hypothetical protein
MFYDAIVCNRMRQRARIGVLCLHKLDRGFEWRETPAKHRERIQKKPNRIRAESEGPPRNTPRNTEKETESESEGPPRNTPRNTEKETESESERRRETPRETPKKKPNRIRI